MHPGHCSLLPSITAIVQQHMLHWPLVVPNRYKNNLMVASDQNASSHHGGQKVPGGWKTPVEWAPLDEDHRQGAGDHHSAELNLTIHNH